MSQKPRRQLMLAEQRFQDLVLGLDIELAVVPGSADPYRIRIHDRAGNPVREIRFGKDGKKTGAGGKVDLLPPQTQLRRVK
jgi:hypothetical protein